MIYFKLDKNYLFADEKAISREKLLGILGTVKGEDGSKPKLENITEEEALSKAKFLNFLFEGDINCTKCTFAVTDFQMLENPKEGLWNLRSTKEGDFNFNRGLTPFLNERKIKAVNISYPGFYLCFGAEMIDAKQSAKIKKKVNILALGDVGGTLLLGLKLLAGDVISHAGIYDISSDMMSRMEQEMNQICGICGVDGEVAMPDVTILEEDQLFDADMFVFCASKGVPPVGENTKDVRMVQFEENKKIIAHYARLASRKKFRGIFAVVSDPVDRLCMEALKAGRSAGGESGLRPEQIKGYGLGVMNSRGLYYAKRDERFSSYITGGRCFGPHGQGLYLVNDIENYDPDLSAQLTKLALNANLKVRETGFKPYIAPAISSGSIPIISTLSGRWHYSTNFLQGAYMGSRSRLTAAGLELERIPMSDILYDKLCEIHEGLKAEI